ncbi:MAG: MotA/TolQ/ExbB proton channel family protein, partial [Spirochaetes bacterium]|nr:MotA/TolQ/ExbB proton channel family protein [Spirochaetota bacterium]
MSGETMIAFFTSWPMWITITPILLCSVISAAAIIERLIFFRKINLDYRAIIGSVTHHLRDGKPGDAAAMLGAYQGPLIGIIRDVAVGMGRKDDTEGIILGASRSAIVAIEKNVGIIATMATVSPMLGLLGTVTGLLKAFMAMYHGGPDASTMLSYGVAEALLTTILGLMVAIPSWVFYNTMVSRV